MHKGQIVEKISIPCKYKIQNTNTDMYEARNCTQDVNKYHFPENTKYKYGAQKADKGPKGNFVTISFACISGEILIECYICAKDSS